MGWFNELEPDLKYKLAVETIEVIDGNSETGYAVSVKTFTEDILLQTIRKIQSQHTSFENPLHDGKQHRDSRFQ